MTPPKEVPFHPDRDPPSSQNVRAVSRALAVLSSFSGMRQLTLAEVAAATGLDKGTARRLLLTLMRHDFVTQDPLTQAYRLGQAIRQLAADVQDGPDLRALVAPIMAELAADLMATVFLSVYADGAAICLERIHDLKGIEVKWWAVGGTMPFNVGAAPKLLLALQSEAEIERVLASQPASRLTDASIVDARTLRTEFAQIRRDGYAMAVDDVARGLTALAVPVFDGSGKLACCLSIAGLTPQMVDRHRPLALDRLRTAAKEVTERLPRSRG